MRRTKPSIDLLLSSAARAYGERLIAVILTGAGSDGAAGAREVKLAGGTVIIENPETASYPSMPASLAPTTVDIVANLDQIGPLLRDLLTGLYVPKQPEALETLLALLEQVRAHSGIDFNLYKRPTILRRLQRRLVATGALTAREYLRYLQRHPEEYGRLIASFLINVTEFFRDQELFTYLREHVVPDLVAQARDRDDHEVRVWSAGCATGEEAYSVAILVSELLGDELDWFSVRIFATDVDADAVAFARRGIYPAAALAMLPDELKNRYFVPVEGGYEIVKRVRGLVIFGEHDLGQRAPFPHIDLVLCRNVLIYFTVELQKRALQLFAFALRNGGYLVLGNSETTSPLASYFAAAHPHFKVYRRQGERVLVPPARPGRAAPIYRAPPVLTLLPPTLQAATQPSPMLEPTRGHEERPRTRTAREDLGNQILSLPVGVVVINREYDVQMLNSAAYRLLDVNRAAIGKDLLHLAERVPTAPLRAAIDAAFQAVPASSFGDETTAIVETTQAERRTLRMSCYPARGETRAGTAERSVESVILFISDVTGSERRRTSKGPAVCRTRLPGRASGKRRGAPDAVWQTNGTGELTQRLAEAQALVRELRAANQELKSINLDLLRANEDLLVGQEQAQAASEEVKTLYEEMQASNEELETLNEEMEATVEELHTANDDLQARSGELQRLANEREEQRQASERERARLAAILASMADALVVVDPAGTVLLANEAYRQLFADPEAAIVLDGSGEHALPATATLRERVGAGMPFRMEFTMAAPDGTRRWFEARGQPVQSDDAQQRGVVSIRDVTEQSLRRLQERFLAMVSHELHTPVTAAKLALQLLTRQLRADAGDTATRDWKLEDMADIALRQMEHLRLMVDDLSDLGRIQQGKLHYDFQPIDLAALIRQLVDGLNLVSADGQEADGEAGDEHRPIMFEAQPARERLRMWGDPLRVEQLVTNLLVNAIKYAGGEGRIDVRLQRAGDLAALEVQDSGPGISAADLPYLFSPFYQVASAESRAQALVEAHSGSISVRSAEGGGTTFTVRFPLLQEASLVAEQRERTLPRQAGEHLD